MKTLLIAAAFCVGASSFPMASQAAGSGSTKVKGCDKEAMSADCLRNFLKADKIFEDLAAGRKPNVKLPVEPGSLGDFGKFLSK